MDALSFPNVDIPSRYRKNEPSDMLEIFSYPLKYGKFVRTVKTRIGPSGIHLFDRTTGLNVLLDEIKVPPSLWSVAPRQVSVALTNACDLDCPYCFTTKNSTKLDLQKLFKWLDELDANGCLGIGFGGGEPTLYPQLKELCQYVTKHTGLSVTITTHAHNFDDTMISSLAGNVHFVRVSMDGIGTTYETLRGRRFASLCQNLDKIRKIVPFGINFVVNSKTLPELEAAIKIAHDIGAVEFLLLPEQPTSHSIGIDIQTKETFRAWVNSYNGPIPLSVSEFEADGLPTCNPLNNENGLLSYAHIDATGTLKRTSFDTEGVLIDNVGIIHAVNTLRTQRTEGAA